MRAKHRNGESQCSCCKRQNLSDVLQLLLGTEDTIRWHCWMDRSVGWLLLLLLFAFVISSTYTQRSCCYCVCAHFPENKKKLGSSTTTNANYIRKPRLSLANTTKAKPEKWWHNVFRMYRGSIQHVYFLLNVKWIFIQMDMVCRSGRFGIPVRLR